MEADAPGNTAANSVTSRTNPASAGGDDRDLLRSGINDARRAPCSRRRVTYLFTIAMVVVWGYLMCNGRPASGRTVATVVLGLFGALAFRDGATVAYGEYARGSQGAVVAGVVLEKATTSDQPRRRTRLRWRRAGNLLRPDFMPHDILGRLILTGSPWAWTVEYRYPCESSYGCRGKAFVSEAVWQRLVAGPPVDVRHPADDSSSSRLEDYPLWGVAAVNLSMGSGLLLGAAVVSGRLKRQVRYVTAPAVVTAVETVPYRDVTRWRIRFAYFDPHGTAQESADEVATDGWKCGDDCVAVFSPRRPDLATLQPIQGA